MDSREDNPTGQPPDHSYNGKISHRAREILVLEIVKAAHRNPRQEYDGSQKGIQLLPYATGDRLCVHPCASIAPEMPAESNVAISHKILAEASRRCIASAAPVPSPSLIFKSRIGSTLNAFNVVPCACSSER